jgi:hypothetical protein
MRDIDRVGLVGYWPFLMGHARDESGRGHHGLLQLPTNKDWQKQGNLWSYRPTGTGRIEVPAHADFITQTITIVLLVDRFRVWSPTERWVMMRSIAGNSWTVFSPTTSRVQVFCPAGKNGNFDFLSDEQVGKRSLAITKADGEVKGKAYLDGIFHAESLAAMLLGLDLRPLHFFNWFSSSAQQPPRTWLQAIAIYNVEKTADEIATIHEYLVSLHCPTVGETRFISTPMQQEDYQDLAIPGGIVNSQVMDTSSNGLLGDIVGTALATPRIQDTPLLSEGTLFGGGGATPAAQKHIEFGTAVHMDYQTEKFGGWCLFIPEAIGEFHKIISRGVFATDGWTFDVTNLDKVRCSTHQAAVDQSSVGTTSLVAYRAYWLGWFSEDSSKPNKVYIEGIDDTAGGAPTRIDPTSNASRVLEFGTQGGLNRANGLVSDLEVGQFADEADFLAKWLAARNKIAQHLMYLGDWGSLAENPATYGAGEFIDNTGIELLSGTWKVETEVVNNTLVKKPICVTAGAVAIPLRYINSAFGTTSVWVNKAAGSDLEIVFCASVKAVRTDTGQNGYMIRLTATEQYTLCEVTAGVSAVLFSTIAAYFSQIVRGSKLMCLEVS